MNFVSGMVQAEYECRSATSAKKSYNRWVSLVKKVIFLPNFVIPRTTGMSEFIRVSQICYVMVAGGSKVIFIDSYKRRTGFKKCQTECHMTS